MRNKLVLGAITGSLLLLPLALPVLAENSSSTAPSGVAVQVACVQAATSKRDGAVSSAFGAYSSAVQSALSARPAALNAAWALTDRAARRSALRNAWRSYSEAVKSARKSLQNSRRSAWSAFKSDMKACHASNEEGSSEGSDASL